MHVQPWNTHFLSYAQNCPRAAGLWEMNPELAVVSPKSTGYSRKETLVTLGNLFNFLEFKFGRFKYSI